jgi:hypothetical protein
MNANGRRSPRRLLVRIGLASAMTLVGMNIWTGSPLLAVWVGAQVQGSQTTLKMSTVGLVILTMAASTFVLYQLLQRLDHRYGEVIGRKPGTRQPVPWLKSISGERIPAKRPREPLTAAERIMVLLVVIAIAVFEVWFFFFAGNSLPH